MEEKDVIIGNMTTILMFVFSTVGGGAIVNMLGGTSQATIFIGACVGFAYSIINAYFPNCLEIFNNNDKKSCTCEINNEPIDDEEVIEEEVIEESDETCDDGGC